MKLSILDLTIIALYLLSTLVIGIYLRNMAKDKDDYLLGGNKLPWYLLGLSNASGMFDISGTMWLVTLMFVYGLKSIWIPWLWPVFNQIFLMIFLSVWLRRSNVTTGAQWITTRFAKGKGAELSHNIVVIFAIISCLGFLAYGFIGLGKFVEIFIPWENIQPFVPFEVPAQYVPHFYGIIFTVFAVIYTVLGGMTSIVWVDVIQYLIMTISSIAIGIIAMIALTEQPLIVPEGWFSPWFSFRLNMDWTGILPEVQDKIRSDGYELFMVFFMMMLFKGILSSAAGPAPNYDMQKILSTKTPKDAALMSGFVSVVLMPARYFMIAGFGVLAILYYDKLNLITAGVIDFEQILPSAINQFVPIGLMGFLIAGLLAAFMSTFAGTLNAAQAYIINDIYVKYFKSSDRSTGFVNIFTGLVVVIVSIILGFFAQNVNSILQWIVSALYGGYIAANVLKWYWWRFNGHGYFWGMLAGIIPALIFPKLLPPLFPEIAPDIIFLYFFPVMLAISFVGCIIGTYLKPATDMNTLVVFYNNVRPWGFWRPVHEAAIKKYPGLKSNKNFGRDMFNVFIGTVWQTALMSFPIFIVIRQYNYFLLSIAIAIVTSIILKFNWYDNLED